MSEKMKSYLNYPSKTGMTKLYKFKRKGKCEHLSRILSTHTAIAIKGELTEIRGKSANCMNLREMKMIYIMDYCKRTLFVCLQSVFYLLDQYSVYR